MDMMNMGKASSQMPEKDGGMDEMGMMREMMGKMDQMMSMMQEMMGKAGSRSKMGQYAAEQAKGPGEE